MAGIYIHIPFCTKKCLYCDFFSGNQLYLIDNYVQALVRELELRKTYLGRNQVSTIYFGGGTPSLLTKDQVYNILKAIHVNFEVDKNAEVTLECNPENVNREYIDDLFDAGVNRISLGVQFWDDEILMKFNRQHSTELINRALAIINQSRFINLSVDIMYSIPGISDDSLKSSLHQLLRYDIKHISAYSLTISRNSQLFWKIQKGEVIETTEDDFISQYSIVREFMLENGYLQYEVSNYAKEGYISLHNMAYWKQVPYLGVGVSAHSYNIESRQWNHSNIKKYIRELSESGGYLNFDSELLSDNQRYNEYVILRLRTFQGLSVSFIHSNFSNEAAVHFDNAVQKLIGDGHFVVSEDLIIPRESDLLIADYLAKVLII